MSQGKRLCLHKFCRQCHFGLSLLEPSFYLVESELFPNDKVRAINKFNTVPLTLSSVRGWMKSRSQVQLKEIPGITGRNQSNSRKRWSCTIITVQQCNSGGKEASPEKPHGLIVSMKKRGKHCRNNASHANCTSQLQVFS